MSVNNYQVRKGGSWSRIVAATKANSGDDPAIATHGKPIGFMLSADGTIKVTTTAGITISLTLLGKIEYTGSLDLVWSTGTDAITVYLLF